MITTRLAAAVVAVLSLALGRPELAHAQAPRYELLDLGVASGRRAAAEGINDAGVVVGTIVNGDDTRVFRTNDRNIAFERDNLGLPPALQTSGGYALAIDINNAGQILAEALPLNASGPMLPYRSYLVPPGGTLANAIDIGTLGGAFNFSTDLNELGQVVGWSGLAGGSQWHAYLYDPGRPLLDLGTLGGPFSSAHGINDLGQITGSAEIPSRVPRAFRTAPNTPMRPEDDLGTLGGNYSNGRAINNRGQIAGMSSIAGESASHLFRTAPNADINPDTDDLGTLPGGKYIEPLDINERGDIVGWGNRDNSQQSAFVVLGERLYDLNDLIDPTLGITLRVAHAINEDGQIVGFGTTPGNPTQRAFLLTPIPEPAALSASVPALLCLARRRRLPLRVLAS